MIVPAEGGAPSLRRALPRFPFPGGGGETGELVSLYRALIHRWRAEVGCEVLRVEEALRLSRSCCPPPAEG